MPETSFWSELSLWDWCNAAGILLVLVGVVGEVAVGAWKLPEDPCEALNPNDPATAIPVELYRQRHSWELAQRKGERKQKRWENFWGGILVIGLLLEMVAFGPDLVESWKLKKETEVARKEAAKARVELARIDPLNLPIRTMRVDVQVSIMGKPSFDRRRSDLKSSSMGYASILGPELKATRPLATLLCTNLRSFPIFQKADANLAIDPSYGTRSILVFEWAEAARITEASWIPDPPRSAWSGDWAGKETVTTLELDKAMKGLILSLPLSGNTRIDEAGTIEQGAMVIMTINGTIQRRFAWPPGPLKHGMIVCPPEE